MLRYVELDFETLSACELKEAGADRYAQDPTTEIICLKYRLDDAQWSCWWPGRDSAGLCMLAAEPDVVFVAHNAAFEQAIWRHIMVPVYGFPPLPVERWDCTLAACAWKSLPLALDKGARALGLEQQKDKEGNALTLSLSRFDKHGNQPELTPEIRDRVAAYCEQDGVVEAELRRHVGLISQQSKHERTIWVHDQRINQRGVRLDLDFIRQAQLVVDRATSPLLAEFRGLTGGLKPSQVQRVIAWAATQGVELDSLQKTYLTDLLGADESEDYGSLAGDDDDEVVDAALPDGVRRALEIRQMLGSASIKKLARMRACVGFDGRARGLLQYHAAHPGRWGGRLFQPQNFPRGTLKVSPEVAVAAIMTGNPEYVETVLGLPAIECVASSLRHALIADPGHEFHVGDYAGIEARIVLALAGQHDKTELMASGFDVYFDMAEDIFNRPKGSWAVTDKVLLDKIKKDFMPQRTIGKNTVLGCGFQMGGKTFHGRYCGDQPIEFAFDVVNTYRKVWAPRVPPLWYALEEAALHTAQTGRPHEAYGVVYKIEDRWLTATLPSRWQKIWYFDPRLGIDPRFGKPNWSYLAQKNGKWVRVNAYGGLLTENVVQALARGLLCASLERLAQHTVPVVLTIHDEIVAEVPRGSDLGRFRDLMAAPTWWSSAMKIPIEVDAWAGERYRK